VYNFGECPKLKRISLHGWFSSITVLKHSRMPWNVAQYFMKSNSPPFFLGSVRGQKLRYMCNII
jgi:hypothetical protein